MRFFWNSVPRRVSKRRLVKNLNVPESLEERALLTITPLTTADPALFGDTANSFSSTPTVSRTGNVIAFSSNGTNLIPGVTSPGQIYAFRPADNSLTLVTQNRQGTGPFTGSANNPVISADGKSILFFGVSDDLVSQDQGNDPNIDQLFLRNLETGTTSLISVTPDGLSAGNDDSGGDGNYSVNGVSLSQYAMSGNGRYVVFWSRATNLVSPAPVNPDQLYVRDLQTNTTRLVSLGADGNPAGPPSELGLIPFASLAISDDGRYVSFTTQIDGLVPGDSNDTDDVYVRDLVANTTELVSVQANGTGPGNGLVGRSAMTRDGSRIYFTSSATDLVDGATVSEGQMQLYMRDLATDRTSLISHQAGNPLVGGNSLVDSFSISSDGRFVAFASYSDDLIAGDTNSTGDIFLQDTTTHLTTLVTRSFDGGSADEFSFFPILSGDGSTLIFGSSASNLIQNFTDNNSFYSDYYVYHRLDGSLKLLTADRVNPASGGNTTENSAFGVGYSSVSDSGAIIAFQNESSNLVAADNNRSADVFMYTAQGIQALSRRDPTLPSVLAAGGSVLATSLDGQYALLAAGPNYRLDSDSTLYVRDTVNGTIVPIPNSQNVGESPSTSMSSDGRFVTFVAGQVRLFDRLTGMTEVISQTFEDTNSSGFFIAAQVSGNGRYVAFSGSANDLVPGFTDGNGSGFIDLYLRDRQSGTTFLVNRKQGTTVTSGNGSLGQYFYLSADGQTVVFNSRASDMAPNDLNGPNATDIYAFNLVTQSMTLVSVNAAGTAAQSDGSFTISADARFVAFVSRGDNLVAGIPGPTPHIYVRDLQSGTTRLVDINAAGTGAGDGIASSPLITPDGRSVAFNSSASNLIAGFPGPDGSNTYVRDLTASTTRLVSVAVDGISGGNQFSNVNQAGVRQISPNGRYIAFSSTATNLVPNFVPGNSTFPAANLYVRDLQTGETRLVTLNVTQTAGGNGTTTASEGPIIMLDDGRVFFSSIASDLVNVFDSNEAADAFLAAPFVNGGGTVSGKVFEDRDGDGQRDPDEPGIFNAIVFDDFDGDGILDPSELSVRTSSDGSYSFASLAVGPHRIRQAIDSFTQVTAPATGLYNATISEPGQVITDRDFGNRILRSNLTVGNVVVDDSGATHQTLNVSWTVTNQGQFVTNALNWHDAVYLSKTPELGPDAILLSTVAHQGSLGVGASYVANTVVGLNLVDDPLVPYFVIVQTDRYHVINESSETDNSAPSASVTVQIPILELNVTSEEIFTARGVPQYFELRTTRGESLRINLDALQGVTELYVRRGAFPTPWQFDYRSQVNGPDQEIVFPVLDDETYYVMVRAVVPPDIGQRAYTLRAQAASFHLDSIDQSSADRGGSITIGLRGADFTPEMSAVLRDATGAIFTATQLLYINPTQAYATFNLTETPVGTYDIRLNRVRKEVYWAVLAGDNVNPVQGRDVPEISTLSSIFQVTEARPDQGEILIETVSVIRTEAEFEINVRYVNQGTHDLQVPLLEVSTDQDLLLAAATASTAYQHHSINVLPLSTHAPYTIIRPGEVGTAVVRTRMNFFQGELTVSVNPTRDDGQAIDFTDFITSLGEDPLSGAGAVKLQRLRDQYGTNYQSLLAGLRDSAERLALIGAPLTTSIDLFLDTVAQDVPLSPIAPASVLTLAPQAPGLPETQPAPARSTLWSTNTSQITNTSQDSSTPTPPPPASAPPGNGTANYDPNSPFNISGGGPNLPLTPEQLISREQVLESVATGFLATGAPTGALHLFRFLGALGPSGGGGTLTYGPDSLVASEIRGDYACDFSYEVLNKLVLGFIKDHVEKRAENLPEGTTEVTEEFRGMQLNFYVGGRLPIGVPVSFDLAVAFGRVAGTSRIPLKITKTKDECGGYKVHYEGTLEYHFQDEYGFHADGGSDLNRIINGYAENLQQAGYAAIFNTEIFMEEDVEGELRLPPKGPPPDDCKSTTPPSPATGPGKQHTITSIASRDPNEIVGPGGFGTDHYRQSDDSTYPYTIRFENDPELATAPAQEVTVTHQLDADLDWSTFELGTIGFGDLHVSVPSGLQSYQTRVEYRNQDGSPLLVDLSAELDRQTGVVTWSLRSVDPVTGTLPSGAFDGFLPVNDDTGRGEGSLQYSIRPKAGLPSGTVFDQQASIIFDLNDAIETNVYRNTLDDVAPVSQIAGLPATSAVANFQVSWAGSDSANGSGIGTYDIYVSDNEGPYTLWLDDTSLTTSMYAGQNGHVYRFYSMATDNVGLTESPPAAADATIRVTETPQLTLGGSGVIWTKKDPPVPIVPDLVVGGTASLGGGVLTIGFDAKGSKKKAKDILTTDSPATLGTTTGQDFNTGRLTLRIELKAGVTPAQVQAFLRSLKFSTSGPGLKFPTRRVDITLANAGGVSTTVSQTITVRKKAPK